jgi:hypothetical protein
MPSADIFVATMHQPARVAGSAAASTPLTGTEAVVLFTIMTILAIVVAWAFLAIMRAQDREMAELAKRYGYDVKTKDLDGRQDAQVAHVSDRPSLAKILVLSAGASATGRSIPIRRRAVYDVTPVEIGHVTHHGRLPDGSSPSKTDAVDEPSAK